MNSNKKIGIIGIGKLGLSFALLAENKGYEVWGSDVRKDYIEQLKNKTFKSSEPLIEEYLQGSTKFYPTTDNIDVILNCDLIYTFVQTSSLPSGEYDHKYIEEVIDAFEALHYTGTELYGKQLVIGCTTNPGYVDDLSDRLEEIGVDVIYNPEFIVQGNIIHGLRNSDIVLIGANNPNDLKDITELYYTIMDNSPNIKVMSPTAAEITKIGLNCYLTTKISFANMIGEICNNSGIGDETEIVLSAIGSDKRIGNRYLSYGFGFGGPCLPRDNRALGAHAEKVGLEINLPYEIDKFNFQHNRYLVNKFVTEYPDKDTTFIFDYVTYKKGVDILEDSQQLVLLLSLLSEGYNCVVIDIEPVKNKLEKPLTNTWGDKIKFLPIGSEVSGVKISL